MARLAKSLETLRAQINTLAPSRDKSSDGWLGDPAHAARKSDHNPDAAGVVRALDITNDPAHGVVATDLAEQIRRSRDPRVSYIISARRIASPEKQDWAWRPYSGANAHEKHVHISVVADNARADDTTPWKVALSPPPPVSAFRFEAKATGIMRRLMSDFPMRDFHAGGILGNIGQECGGFTLMQQAGKTPPAGGWSWCQWDGVRRVAFNEWADQHGLARDSDEAAYSFLVHELRTTEKGALNALLSTTTLEEATLTFSRRFERPGIPHEDRRVAYAKRALAAFRAADPPARPPVPVPPAPSPKPATPMQHWSLWGAIAAAFAGIATFFEGSAIVITGVAILIAFAAFILRPKKAPP